MLISLAGIIRYTIENPTTVDNIHDELLEFSTHFISMVDDQPATKWEVDVRTCNEHSGFRCWTSKPFLVDGNEDGLDQASNIFEAMNVFKAIFAHMNTVVADREVRLLEYDSTIVIELRLIDEEFISKLGVFNSLGEKLDEINEENHYQPSEECLTMLKDIHTLVVNEKLSRQRKLRYASTGD